MIQCHSLYINGRMEMIQPLSTATWVCHICYDDPTSVEDEETCYYDEQGWETVVKVWKKKKEEEAGKK